MREVRRRDAARRGGDRRLVRLGRDALRAVSLPLRERGRSSRSAFRPITSARGRIRPEAGSTRCWPSRRCCSIESSYRNCVCLGLISDPEGQKMSKSRGNAVDPWQVFDTQGADAFRWYLLSTQQPWAGYRFSVETIGEALRQVLLTLWNTYSFFVLYANADEIATAEIETLPAPESTVGPRSVGVVAPSGADRDGHRADGRLRLHHGRAARSRPVRGRALELVRATQSPALLGRRPGCVRDPAPLPGHPGEADGPVHPLPRRRDPRQPQRWRRLGPPHRLPRAGSGVRRWRARGGRRGCAASHRARPCGPR